MTGAVGKGVMPAPRVSLFISFFISLALLGHVSPRAEAQEKAAPFEIKDGDRVLLLGDTLLERENSYGFLELRMHEQFLDRKFSVRNLSWSGETPRGISRASFDPPEKGFERLKEQIALVKPTVVFLGFGMAASLQEMTDRAHDWTLNPEPARYGAEPMSAGRFKKELGELMDAIGKDARFVLLSPIKHEDLRKDRPGLPDPAEHNKLLEQYSRAIEELAKECGAIFVNPNQGMKLHTDNGIHPNYAGNVELSFNLGDGLGWRMPDDRSKWTKEKVEVLQPAILRKNALWFHRTRPANETYLFGFRKHEQGQNAKEIPEFDPLVEQADAEIDRLKRAKEAPGAAPVAAVAKVEPLPAPTFDLGENLEISLWADTPLLVKPTQMNWDALGRLWVCGTAHYPQIAPGEIEKDQIFILEDTDHDGKADKSTVFAGGMLLPTCIVPDLGTGKDGKTLSACYVGASTELIRFEDTDGDGKADAKRIVFTGFGTEDTHHNVHTLKWGPDGKLYFDQSVYTHTHLETPWGMVRLNAGGVFAYDPRTERVEVFCKGLWNPWGHVIDRNGQHFFTDGAGRDGIAWAFPGAVFAPSEGARQTMPLISPGTYPKFAGLEQIRSPHFPDDWQDTAVTCDFRAHRIVRFKINDLGPAKSGFVTSELPDIARTADLTFRPIDIKLGPDGALYIADWTNPVINHGEVDFRDPRRDHTHGRIWRVTYKGRPTVKWEPLVGKSDQAIVTAILGNDLWAQEQGRRVLRGRWGVEALNRGINRSISGSPVQSMGDQRTPEAMLESAWLAFPTQGPAAMDLLRSPSPNARAAILRSMARFLNEFPAPAAVINDAIAPGYHSEPGFWTAQTNSANRLRNGAHDRDPRVRIEAMRGLVRVPTAETAAQVLEASAERMPADDPYYAFAAWRSVNDVAEVWVDAVLKGEWALKPRTPAALGNKTEAEYIAGREKQLEFALKAIEPGLAGKVLAQLVSTGKAPLDGSGPWFELIGLAGSGKELRALFDAFAGGKIAADVQGRALGVFVNAARNRNLRPDGDVSSALELLRARLAQGDAAPAAVRLLGLWKLTDAMTEVAGLAREGKTPQPVRDAAFDALKAYGDASALRLLDEMTRPEFPLGLRRHAMITIAQTNFQAGFVRAKEVLHDITNADEALGTWRALLAINGAPVAFAHRMPQDLPQSSYAAGLRAAREIGKKGQELVAVLTPLAGTSAQPPPPADYTQLVQETLASGDPAAGEEVYRRTGLACTVCHAVGGAGGKVGPELGTIGASAPLDYIIESILNPNAKVKEGYNAVSLTQKDGNVSMGVPVRESSADIVIRTATGQEQTIAKELIKQKDNLGSIMPAGLTEQLKPRERINLYAFLSQLGKKGVYDASQGHIARTWWVADSQDAKATKVPVLTNVDGRLSRERLGESLAIFPNASAVYVSAKISAAAPTKTQLGLIGVREAWLDGKPLAVASEPSPAVELSTGEHVLAVKLDPKSLPEVLRAEAANTRFLTE